MKQVNEYKTRIIDSKIQYWFNGAWYFEDDALKIINSINVLDKLFDNYDEKIEELPKECFKFKSEMSEEKFEELLKSIKNRGRLIIKKIYKVYNSIENYYKLYGLLKGIEVINKDEFMFVNKNIERLNKIYPMIPIDKFQTVLRYYCKFNIPCSNRQYKPLDEAIKEETNYNLFEYVYCLSALYKTKYYIEDVDSLQILDDDISNNTKQIHDKLDELLKTKYIIDDDKSFIKEIIYICKVIISISKKIRFIESNIDNNLYSQKEQTIINELKRHSVKSRLLIEEYYNKLVKNYNELQHLVDKTTIDKLKGYLIDDIINDNLDKNKKY